MKDPNEIDSLLLRILLGEASREEQRQFKEWVAADAGRTDYYRNFQRSFLKLQWGIQSSAVKGNFKQFYQQKVFLPKLRRWYRSAAACLFLFLSAGGSLLLYNRPQVLLSGGDQIEAIRPGGTRAVLYLASGKAIPVDTVPQILCEKGETEVKITGQGEVVYEAGFQGDEVVCNQVVTPRGGEYSVVLSDGTKVWLNADSKLYYPVSFHNRKREVWLSGEAYFDVAKDSGHPFVVRVDDLSVQVFGTQFNINTHLKGSVETVLVEGSISISFGHKCQFLKPGQLAEYRKGEGVLEVAEVDVTSYVAWKDGNFIFHNEPLESILEKLSLWYDLEVFYVNPQLRHVRLSGNLMKYKDVRELFEKFERISEARFGLKGKTVTVSK